MSCHNMGRGLNDEGSLDSRISKSLLFTIERGVHQGDGNEYEADASLYGHRCGKRLKSTENLYTP